MVWMQSFWGSLDAEMKFYLIFIAAYLVLTIAGVVASVKVNSTFSRYAAVAASCGLTADQIARRILDANGLYNVQIRRISGNLTDNYHPTQKVLSLSQSVYGSRSVSAIGVACHEAGHAVQHAKGYFFSSLRLKLVPVVNFANSLIMPLMLVGMILGFGASLSFGRIFIWAGVIIFGLSLLFSLVTLPTEFDASRRAQKALKEGYFSSSEAAMSRKVLTAAAMTYIVSFLMSLLQFARFLFMLLLSRRRD